MGLKEGVLINRAWAMPNKNTFSIKPIREFLNTYLDDVIKNNGVIVDPFSGGVRLTANSVTNDLNPEIEADSHLDALEFLKGVPDESADAVLYDPPYSLRQVVECYKGFGKIVTQEDTKSSWRARHLDEIERILKPGGKAFCFGWNSNGVGKKRHFRLISVLIVAHGGSKNDTICTCEVKEEENRD